MTTTLVPDGAGGILPAEPAHYTYLIQTVRVECVVVLYEVVWS